SLSLAGFRTVSFPTSTHTPSLHDALPISPSTPRTTHGKSARPSPTGGHCFRCSMPRRPPSSPKPSSRPTKCTKKTPCAVASSLRSEEHTSELQSRENLVCRLLLAKQKQKQ